MLVDKYDTWIWLRKHEWRAIQQSFVIQIMSKCIQTRAEYVCSFALRVLNAEKIWIFLGEKTLMSSSLNCICSASDVFILRVIRCIYIEGVIARRLIKVLPTQSKLPVIQNNLPYPNRICEYDNPDCLLLNRSLDFSHPVYLLLGSFINVC